MQETWVQSLGWKDSVEKRTAMHSSILAWRIPWTEEPGRLCHLLGTRRLRDHGVARSQTQLSSFHFNRLLVWNTYLSPLFFSHLTSLPRSKPCHEFFDPSRIWANFIFVLLPLLYKKRQSSIILFCQTPGPHLTPYLFSCELWFQLPVAPRTPVPSLPLHGLSHLLCLFLAVFTRPHPGHIYQKVENI